MSTDDAPRIVLISQWPKIKNAEYELIERVKRTGYKLAVTDFLGFDVDSGECLNSARIGNEYDFAISLHYETPKFLNLPTYLWVANPLEFMHAQATYRTHVFHNIRSYDDYLYNGSPFLKAQIKAAVGSAWRDSGLSFFGACSRRAILAPQPSGAANRIDKIFYCGVNWERTTDQRGRAQGLLDTLQARQLAEFYGPKTLLHIDPWAGFSSYRGEIPFDGSSIFGAIQRYTAALAVSSPAHLKSKTSSSRSIESFAAGVPVISDENPHVRQQFGDLVYYFKGKSETERADSIEAAFARIRSDPEEAAQKVREAQELISQKYCYEASLERLTTRARDSKRTVASRTAGASAVLDSTIDVYLLQHDPYAVAPPTAPPFPNALHVAAAAAKVAHECGARISIHYDCAVPDFVPPHSDDEHVRWIRLATEEIDEWRALLLGEKIARLSARASGNFVVFFNEWDFPQQDYLISSLNWSRGRERDTIPAIHIGGFFVSPLAEPAPPNALGILRNNSPKSMYRWSQNSIAEHQLGQFFFTRAALERMDMEKIARFDILLPIAILLEAQCEQLCEYRSPHLLLRVAYGYYHRYIDAFAGVNAGGFWSQQYELLSNRMHEFNRLYDAFHEHADVVRIVDRIYGYDLPPNATIDPAVHQVNQFIELLRPTYRRWLRIRDVLRSWRFWR